MLPKSNAQRMAFSQLPSIRKESTSAAPVLQPSQSTGGFDMNRGRAPPKVLIIQNDLLCNPCIAIASLIDHDIEYHVIYAFHDGALKNEHPLMYEAIMVLGGRAAVYEAKPFLVQEMTFMQQALRMGVPILGICLGCQLLAKCIGGNVVPGTDGAEIGYKKWHYPRIDSFTPGHPMLPHPDHYQLQRTETEPIGLLEHHEEPKAVEPVLRDLKLSSIGRSASTTSLGIRRAVKEDGHELSSLFEMKMAHEMLPMTDFDEDEEVEFFEESDDDDLAAVAAAAAAPKKQKGLFRIAKRPCDDSSDDDTKSESAGPPVPSSVARPAAKAVEETEVKSKEELAEEMRRYLMMMDKDPAIGIKDVQQKMLRFVDQIMRGGAPAEDDGVEAVDQQNEDMDPFERVIYRQEMDRFVILFHGDTFDLPEKCVCSKKDVRLLATTNYYRTLFRVGDANSGVCSYGFQGHPELTPDMLSVWCKCWGDEFLKKWETETGGDLDRDVLDYAAKNAEKIKEVSRTIFDMWCKEVVLRKIELREHGHLHHRH